MSKRPELVGKDRTSTVPVATSLCDNRASQSAREAHHAEGIHEMEENRKKALAAALGQIEKQFGKGSVMRLGDAGATYEVESIPTGSLGLDIALGVGGIPKGRVIEIFGPESSGKTTLTLAIIASAQKA